MSAGAHALAYGDVGSSASDSESDGESDTGRASARGATRTGTVGTTVGRAKLAYVERAFASEASEATGDGYDEMSTLAFTESEYREACAERGRMGRCAWLPCREASARAAGGKRYDVDGSARVVRDGAFVGSFCCKEHVLAAEALAKRLGKNGRAMSAKEGAATKPAAARLARSAVKDEVLEREVVEIKERTTTTTTTTTMSAEVKPPGAPLSAADARLAASAVDGYVPRAARRDAEKEKKKTAATTKITWNEEELANIEREKEEKKEAAAADPNVATGVFYFDTFGEGKKPDKEYVPSIGGRFAEGQLRTDPRPVVDEESVLKAMETLGIEAETSASTGGDEDVEKEKDVEEDQAESTRKALASTLTAKPIPGFFDDNDDDDDDDDDENGTMTSHSDDDDVSTSMPTISQFGLTWMAVDNLVTEATFALVAGDGSFVDKLPPRDKYSVSVSEAWNETLASKAVPLLCSTLKISSERRRIEQNLTTLLRTFAFDRAVPAFTNERWVMLGLLFVELLLDADLMSKETIGKEVLDNADAVAIYASADATSEEVDLLRQRLRGGGVR